MFIILRRDDWDGLAIVINHLGKPKHFVAESEALDYIKELELTETQIVEVTI